jgi:hypothetical protein
VCIYIAQIFALFFMAKVFTCQTRYKSPLFSYLLLYSFPFQLNLSLWQTTQRYGEIVHLSSFRVVSSSNLCLSGSFLAQYFLGVSLFLCRASNSKYYNATSVPINHSQSSFHFGTWPTAGYNKTEANIHLNIHACG